MKKTRLTVFVLATIAFFSVRHTAGKTEPEPFLDLLIGKQQARGQIHVSTSQRLGQIKYLDASATLSDDGKTLYLAVINLHAEKRVKTEISFDKYGFSSTVKLCEQHDEDYMTENTF